MKRGEARGAAHAKRPAHATTLAALEDHGAFVPRHIGSTDDEQAAMLSVIGQPTRAALMDAVVPAAIRNRAPLPLPGPRGEQEALAALRAVAARNDVKRSFIGQGYYGTHTPPVILRNILENPAWYTAYTPYQPEIAQGRLEALVNFQTMVCDLTGMAIANASMLDEATAAAEAMTLLRRVSSAQGNVFVVAPDVLPPPPTRCSSVIASAAAVASSSIDALAMSIAVRSVTIVWKFSSASSRPCAISG